MLLAVLAYVNVKLSITLATMPSVILNVLSLQLFILNLSPTIKLCLYVSLTVATFDVRDTVPEEPKLVGNHNVFNLK